MVCLFFKFPDASSLSENDFEVVDNIGNIQLQLGPTNDSSNLVSIIRVVGDLFKIFYLASLLVQQSLNGITTKNVIPLAYGPSLFPKELMVI